MTRDEQKADLHLVQAKLDIKDAFKLIDPVATEPVAQAILKALDSIDVARTSLRGRG